MSKSSLAERLKSAKPLPTNPPPGSRVDRIIADLERADPEAAHAFVTALRDPQRVSTKALVNILSDEGIHISYSAINAWRRREGCHRTQVGG